MVKIDEILRDYMDKTGMKTSELADVLGVHPNTLLNWLNKHHYPAFDVGQIAIQRLGYDIVVTDKKANNK